MSKKFSNNYRQDWKSVFTLDGKIITRFPDDIKDAARVEHHTEYSPLVAVHEKCSRKTKMMFENLPDTYVRLRRGYGWDDILNSAGVKDLRYHWIMENHFMRDSLLQVSYGDTNLDDNRYAGKLVFGYEIFKFVAAIKKNSPDCDLTNVRNGFIEHCEWLKENEPGFAPLLDECEDYGVWFDKKINENYNL